MAENNSVCSICGKGYYMCLSCKDSMALSPWKIHTDTSEHYKVYQILHGYSTGVFNKEEARLKLQMVDLSDLDSFREHIKSLIKNILDDTEDKESTDYTNVKSTKESTVSKNVKATRKRKSKVVETE